MQNDKPIPKFKLASSLNFSSLPSNCLLSRKLEMVANQRAAGKSLHPSPCFLLPLLARLPLLLPLPLLLALPLQRKQAHRFTLNSRLIISREPKVNRWSEISPLGFRGLRVVCRSWDWRAKGGGGGGGGSKCLSRFELLRPRLLRPRLRLRLRLRRRVGQSLRASSPRRPNRTGRWRHRRSN